MLGDAGQRALDDADDHHAFQTRARHRHEAVDHLLLLVVAERHVPQDGVADLRPVEQEKEQGVEKQQELGDERDGALRGVRQRAARNRPMALTTSPVRLKISSRYCATRSNPGCARPAAPDTCGR